MANKHHQTPGNVPGPYYVDDTCVDCGMCPSIAPGSFRRNDEHGVSITYRQPVSAEELALAEDARTSCPSESIGNDGDAP
jgi:ferredoxin